MQSKYLKNSRHSEKDIDKTFFKRTTIPTREALKKKSNGKQDNKIRFITEYEPSLPNIYNIWRKTNHLLKIMKNWKICLRTVLRIFK